MAIVLPWVELLAAVLLARGLWLKEMVWLLGGLSVVYEVAATSALIRGINITCGCFGENYQGSAWSVAGINAALLSVLFILWRAQSKSTLKIDEVKSTWS